MIKALVVDKDGAHEVNEDDLFCKTCNYISCICSVVKGHEMGCTYRSAVCCPVGIECEHGYDVCPICDPCTCKTVREFKENGLKPVATSSSSTG